jgi:predicted PurR-regulated permease PerM
LAARVSAGPSTLSALLFTLLVALILFLPLALAVYQIAQQSDQVAAWIAQSRDNGIAVPEWIARLPIAADAVQQWWRENLAEPRSVAMWLQSLNLEKAGDLIRAFGGQLLHRLFMFFVTLLALFAFLRNGDLIDGGSPHADRIFGIRRRAGRKWSTGPRHRQRTVMVAVTEGLLIASRTWLWRPNPVPFTILTIAFAMLPFGAWVGFSVASSRSCSRRQRRCGIWCLANAVVTLAGDHFGLANAGRRCRQTAVPARVRRHIRRLRDFRPARTVSGPWRGRLWG